MVNDRSWHGFVTLLTLTEWRMVYLALLVAVCLRNESKIILFRKCFYFKHSIAPITFLFLKKNPAVMLKSFVIVVLSTAVFGNDMNAYKCV